MANDIPEWHKELEMVMPVLKVKGKLLANLQEKVDQIGAINHQLSEAKKHCDNLNEIKYEQEQIIESIRKRDQRIKRLLGISVIKKAARIIKNSVWHRCTK